MSTMSTRGSVEQEGIGGGAQDGAPQRRASGFVRGTDELVARAEQVLQSKARQPAGRTKTWKPEPPSEKFQICVGGASGFLGAWTVAQCVARGFKTVALCRRPQTLSARLNGWGLEPSWGHGVQVLESHLESMQEHEFPAAEVYIHCAGRTHAMARLEELWRDNVEAPAQACRVYASRGARVIHASTLSCFVSSNQSGVHQAQPIPASPTWTVWGGYAQSKVIAEHLTLGLGACNVRLGLLTGSVPGGILGGQTFFETVCRGLSNLGVAPQDFQEAFVDVTPVNLAADYLVDIAQEAKRPDIIHGAHPESLALSEMVQALKLRAVSAEEFQAKLSTCPPMLSQLIRMAFFKNEQKQKHPLRFNCDLFQATGHDFQSKWRIKESPQELLALYLKKWGLESS